jgi:hypothetical protein
MSEYKNSSISENSILSYSLSKVLASIFTTLGSFVLILYLVIVDPFKTFEYKDYFLYLSIIIFLLGLVASLYFLLKLSFPLVVSLFGILMISFSITKEPIAGQTQTEWFLYGAIVILVIGIATTLYMLEMINKIIHFVVMGLSLIICVALWAMSVNSVSRTQAELIKYDNTRKAVIQGLSDIRDIQVAYKKKTGKYTDSFDTLRKFLLEEKTYKTVRIFPIDSIQSIPDRKPTLEEAALLGYDPIKDEAKILDGIDEKEAIILGFLEIDTLWFPVLENLFTGKEAAKRKREYVFNIDEFEYVPMNPEKIKFVMKVAEIDSVTNYFMAIDPKPLKPLGYKPDQPHPDTLKVGSLTENSTTGSWGN